MYMKTISKHIESVIMAVVITLSATTVHAQTGHYEWNSLPFGGAGFVSGVITCPQEAGVVYARTDVGGAYRWDAEKKAWQPITDFLGADKAGLMGVESLAIDPSSPNKVYMYCGTSYWNNGLSAILCSEDYGETFTQLATVTGQFPAHGNDYGRQSGERLAVCPTGGHTAVRFAHPWIVEVREQRKDVAAHGYNDVCERPQDVVRAVH